MIPGASPSGAAGAKPRPTAEPSTKARPTAELSTKARPTAIELFSGIGAFCTASRGLLDVLESFDQDQEANRTHALNHGSSPCSTNLCSVSGARLHAAEDPGWLMSPPCQPFTRKGNQRDLDDPRTEPLKHLLELLPRLRPRFLVLENVPPFADSRAFSLLAESLTDAGLFLRTVRVCPTRLGIPNRRDRLYVLATRTPLPDPPPTPLVGKPLADYLDPQPSNDLTLDPDWVAAHHAGLSIVYPHPQASPSGPAPDHQDSCRAQCSTPDIAACFGSSYGHSRTRSGSVLALSTPPQTHLDSRSLRRFSPSEILRLLHFPPDFRFPPDTTLRTQYRLAGNSINVAVLRYLIKWIAPLV